MGKALKILGVLVILLLVGGVVTWYYLPTIMVKAITSEGSGLSVIPSSMKQTVNARMDEVPNVLKTLEAEGVYITIDDIIKEIDEAEVEEITRTIGVLENTELSSTEQVIR